MHLLNVRTRRIEEFYGKTIPKYAILSHTWGRHEISFQAMQSYGARYKRWPRKLSGLCMQAAADGIDYVWIDTCCINKKDLVELSESINSMFTWYQKATVCYVYLADVQLESGGKTGTNWRAFRRSRWFTRGWTLQELLAPDQMKFYDSEWTFFGTKRELSAKLQAITNIPRSFILGATPVSEASVAQRFSWVASRETTRVEDMAYCLLGLFNVNMPMIYGEGEKAFVRLQHEIMKVHRDQSILAWGFDVDDEGNLRTNLQQNQTEVLATRPQQFRHCGRLVKSQNFRSQNTFEWLTGTLKLQLTLYTDPDDGEAYGLLNCGHEATLDKVVGLALVKLPAEGSDCYTRKPGSSPKLVSYRQHSAANMLQPQVVQLMGSAPRNPHNIQSWIYLEEPVVPFEKYSFSLTQVLPAAAWKQHRDMIDTSVTSEPIAVSEPPPEPKSGSASEPEPKPEPEPEPDPEPGAITVADQGTREVNKPGTNNRESVFYLRYRYTQYGSSAQPEDDFVVRVELDRAHRPKPMSRVSVNRVPRKLELQDYVRTAAEFDAEELHQYTDRAESDELVVAVHLWLRPMAGQPVFVLELSAGERSGHEPNRDQLLWQLTGLHPALRLPHYESETAGLGDLVVGCCVVGTITFLPPWLVWKLWLVWRVCAGLGSLALGEGSSWVTMLFLMPIWWLLRLLWFLVRAAWFLAMLTVLLYLPFAVYRSGGMLVRRFVAEFWQL